MMLVQENGDVVPALIEIANKNGANIGTACHAGEVSERLQQTWFKEGKLRNEITGQPPKAEDLVLLKQLGCIDEIRVPAGEYAGAFVAGSLITGVRNRLAFLQSEYNRGVHFSTIVMLGGERPLNTEKELPILEKPGLLSFKKDWVMPTVPKTETEMMKLVADQSILPSEWKLQFVDAKMQPKAGGGTKPPNTSDTVREWLAQGKPVDGEYVLASSQPYVQYQTLTVLRALIKNPMMCVFGAGPAASSSLPLATFLDNLAKQLYEECQFLEAIPHL